jgi:hypothetical protein
MKSTQTADVEFIRDLPKELVNTVGEYTSRGLKQTDTRLYERKTLDFRQIVDSVFPTMLVIDYSNIERELKKYSDIGQSLKTALGDAYTPSLDKKYTENKLSDKEIDLIVKTIRAAAKQFATNSISVSQRNLLLQLNQIIRYDREYGTVLQGLKELFVDTIHITDLSNVNRDVFLYNNFNDITSSFTKEINKQLSLNPIKNVNTISEFLDYGHTAIGYQEPDGSIKLQFNSPKVINIIFDVITDTSGSAQGLLAAQQASVNFIEQARQTEEYLTIEKDFSEGFIKVFVSIGGNIVRFENSVVNQRRGSVLEKSINTQSNSKTLRKLGELIGAVGGKIATQIRRALITGRGSPSVLDYIANSIMATIKGETVTAFKEKITKTNKKSDKVTVPTITGFTKGVKKVKRPAKVVAKQQPMLSGATKQDNQLLSLQNLLNSNLVQTVKQNMGNGTRRDILNLRSGRFAESVRVERLTKGREGMVTAYYDYMRYPYATFSDGGKQEQPRSRNPKLLISKSIRQVAAQAKITRLRAVLV